MIVSADPTHKTRKEWQDTDSYLMSIIDAIDSVSPHAEGSLYRWIKSGKGYYQFRREK